MSDMPKNCELCGHFRQNHWSNGGCAVPGCKCERTFSHTDHPTYQEQDARIRALEAACRVLAKVVSRAEREKMLPHKMYELQSVWGNPLAAKYIEEARRG